MDSGGLDPRIPKWLKQCSPCSRTFSNLADYKELIDSNIITFNLEKFIPRLQSQLDFMIQVILMGKTIHINIFDEGASTCINSIVCWKAIDSHVLSQFLNTLQYFDG